MLLMLGSRRNGGNPTFVARHNQGRSKIANTQEAAGTVPLYIAPERIQKPGL
jgi:hypothetical protein